MRSLLVAGVLTLVAVSQSAAAQTVRGTVGDAAQAPVPGVVVTLLDSTSAIVARGLTNEQGAYRLTAQRAGTYRLRTLRIGFRPVLSEPFALAAGQELAQPLVVARVQVALDTVRVADRASCRLDADSAAATFAVWEQVRTALTATQLTASARAIRATTLDYDRTLDASFRRVQAQSVRSRTEHVTQSWRTISPDALHRTGYVANEADGTEGGVTVYSAPGLDLLVSPMFVADHCFRLTTGRDPSVVGVAFEPTPERAKTPEIQGTLWVDRKTSELRRLEYRYANLPREQAEHAGGEMRFARLTNGGWAITQWEIRMPALTSEQLPNGTRALRVAEVHVTGGALALAVQGANGRDTVYAQPALAVHGTVTDSLTGAPVVGGRLTLAGTVLRAATDSAGRFAFPSVLPGVYTLEVRSPSLDALGAAHQQEVVLADSATAAAPLTVRVPTAAQLTAALCRGVRADGANDGILVGTVYARGDSAPRGRVSVVAEWVEQTLRTGAETAVEKRPRWVEMRTDASGAFRLCGVARGAAVTVRASSDSGGAARSDLRFDPGQRLARLTLTLDAAAAPVATFTGAVRADSTERVISGAEVSLPDLDRRVQTNEAGQFRVSDVPAGTHRVLVRRLGYGPLDTKVTFAANRTTQRTIFLSTVRTLDSVVVSEKRDPAMEDFDANRKLGLGHFLTRVDLEQAKARQMGDVFRQFSGARVLTGTGSRAWVASSRGVKRLDAGMDPRRCQPPPREGETKLDSSPCDACYPLVYLDGVRLSGREVPNINRFTPNELEAVEYYAGPAELPARYSDMKTNCGAIVLHTRRTP